MQVGEVISGKYRLVRLLGDGGMGSVYEARHERLGTRVAIKFLHTELARHRGLVDRFLQEARVSAQIRSPHVVQVTDIDQTSQGEAYIVMELLEGEPLSAVLDRQRRLPVPVACEYATQVLDALEAAHALGVVHRDLKPENVFVTTVGSKSWLKLIDFGIAKLRAEGSAQKNLTVAGVLMGTAEYMAPEQAFSADKADARSDVYSVGVMLYEMIAGVRPVSGEDARVIATKVERGDVVPLLHAAPFAPREIAGLVHRAMAARPELRFSSALEMRTALSLAAGGKRTGLTGASALASDAGTGTVMGAPADALLGTPRGGQATGPTPAAPVTQARSTPIAPAMPPHLAAPVHLAPPPHRTAAPAAPRRSSRGIVIALLAVVVLLLGGLVASQLGLGRSETTPAAAPESPPAPPPPTPAPPASAAPSAPPPALAPLGNPPPRPPSSGHAPPRPPPQPSASGAGEGADASVPASPLPIPPLPFPPFPAPSGFPIPSGFPPIPIPLPNFAPPTPSASAPSALPTSGY